MGRLKRSRVIIAVVALALVSSLVALLVLFRPRPPLPVAPNALDTSHGPAFDLRVEKPRQARPLFGILPTKVEEKLFGGGELRFDNTRPGATVVRFSPDRLELRADGWDLSLVTDAAGRVTPETRLLFPIVLGEKQRALRCRPADFARGYLRTTKGAVVSDGSFVVELAICENAESGKVIEWPPAPLTVRGSFAGLTQNTTRDQK
ncbi:MAG: hypothetical protein ABIP75_17635 [Pyrinomonadaceae bacterium]